MYVLLSTYRRGSWVLLKSTLQVIKDNKNNILLANSALCNLLAHQCINAQLAALGKILGLGMSQAKGVELISWLVARSKSEKSCFDGKHRILPLANRLHVVRIGMSRSFFLQDMHDCYEYIIRVMPTHNVPLGPLMSARPTYACDFID